MPNNTLIIIGLIIILLIGGGVSYFSYQETSAPSVYDGFAQCLGEKGVTFFGAFWCPHCQNQKKMFGGAASLLPYVECSTPNGQGRLQICIDEDIKNYPTWEFADGSREVGELSFQKLAEKSGCVLPDGAVETTPVETSSSSSSI